MVDTSLFERDALGDEEWAVTPEPDAIVPDAIAREREREAFRAELDADPDSIVLTHIDADGLTSAALLSQLTTGKTVVQTVDYQAPYRFEHVLEDLTNDELGFDPNGTRLSIADFNPDSTDGCKCAY